MPNKTPISKDINLVPKKILVRRPDGIWHMVLDETPADQARADQEPIRSTASMSDMSPVATASAGGGHQATPGDAAACAGAIANTTKPVTSVEHMDVEASIQGAMPYSARRNSVVFPLCDAAVRKAEGSEWELADAIVAECSEPGEDGVRNGSQAAMEAMRQEIAKNHGVDLSLERIRKLRKVASAFPPGRRRPGVSVEAHLEAGTPDALDQLVKAAPAGTTFTRANVRELKHPTEQDEKSKQKQEQRRQAEDHQMALQNVCRKLEQENELLRQRYEDPCRSAGKEPEPLSPPLAPEANAKLQQLPPVIVPPAAGVTTGDGLALPPFLDRRPLSDDENKELEALVAARSSFVTAWANASPLVRYRFETQYGAPFTKGAVDVAPPTVPVADGEVQAVAVVAQQ